MKAIRKEQQQPFTPAHSSFIKLLGHSNLIPAEAKKYLNQHTSQYQIPPHTTLLQSGQTAQSIYLVHSGVLRFHKQHAHRINSDAMFFPGAIAPSPIDFYFEMPVQSDLVTVVPTIVQAIDLSHVRILFRYYPQVLQSLPNLLLQSRQVLNERQQWEHLSTKEKIREFLARHPDAPRCVTFKIIATYLGIKAETLSRHRSALYIGNKSKHTTKS